MLYPTAYDLERQGDKKMGRPLNKKFFGNRNIGTTASTDSGIGGEGIASITLGGSNNSVGFTNNSLTQATVPAPSLPNGVQAVLKIHTFAAGALTNKTTFSKSGTSVAAAGTYGTTTAPLASTSATGTGATFIIVKTGSGTTYNANTTITLVDSGSGYSLTDTQKQRLIDDVIKPISVVTVEPTIVDPDYTYLKLTSNVLYDTKRTVRTAQQLQSAVKTTISNFTSTNLNTFNSTFDSSDLNYSIRTTDLSIVANETTVQVQKKIMPNFTTPTTYKLYFGTELKKGMFQSGISSYPALQFRNPLNAALTTDGIYIEELPVSTGGIQSILLTNPGFGYQIAPTVKILGDGTGATAEAVLNTDGSIQEIKVTNKGSSYTSALVTITPADNDTTGQLGAAVASLEGQYGTLRLYYNDSNNVKTIFNNNIGTVDYTNGIITLNDFGPLGVNDPLGQLTITANPVSTIISSSYNRVVTVDEYDSAAVTVNVTAKTS